MGKTFTRRQKIRPQRCQREHFPMPNSIAKLYGNADSLRGTYLILAH